MNVAIIAAAGRGTRMGGERAKQFLELGGTPIIIHTLRRFEQCATIGEVIVVVPADAVGGFIALAGRHRLGKLARIVPGGQTRTETVWRGLQAMRAATTNIVAVHDGVRPFVTPEEIDRTVRAAEATGAAILAVPATDTIKEVAGGCIRRTLPRAEAWHAQTPQCFRYELLRRAHEQARATGTDATDDSALVEQLGATVAVVEGSSRNVKITRPEDIALAETLLTQMPEAGS